MKKKIMSLSCLMVAAALAGCSAAAPAAASEETTTPETSEMTEIPPEAAPAATETPVGAEDTDLWKVEPAYSFDAMIPLYSEWDHTAGRNEADGMYAVRTGERWSLFDSDTGSVILQDEAQQMPYLFGGSELSVWLDESYYNSDFEVLKKKYNEINAELQANGADMEVQAGDSCVFMNRWIYTADGQIYYELLGNFEFDGTPLAQVSDAPALFGVQQAAWDNDYQGYTVDENALYAVADSAGNLLTDFQYQNVCMYGSDLIAVQDETGNWGYCDKSGNEVIPCVYQAEMDAQGLTGPIDYAFPDMSGIVVVQGADGAKSALYTDGTPCIEEGRFEDLAPAQGGCVWAKQNGLWGLLEVK